MVLLKYQQTTETKHTGGAPESDRADSGPENSLKSGADRVREV